MNSITISASLVDVEKAARKLITQVFYETPRRVSVIDPKSGNVFDGQIGIEIVPVNVNDMQTILWIKDKNIVRGKAKDLSWGFANLTAKNNQITISLKLWQDNIWAYCNKNTPEFDEKKQHYLDRIEIFNEKLLQEFKKGKRESTLAKQRKVIKAFKAMEKENQKEFREALHSEDVKRHKTTAKDVFEAHGAEIGLGLKSIQDILKAHKEQPKP